MAPHGDPDRSLQIRVSSILYNDYVGRICVGRIYNGKIKNGQQVALIKRDGSLVKTKVPQVHFHRYPARNEQHFGRLFAVIRAYLDDLDSGRFVFRPGMGCSWCDFRETLCRSWAGS